MSLCRIIDCASEDPFAFLAQRELTPDDSLREVVRKIISDVKERGDEALLELTRRFDSEQVADIQVIDKEIQAAGLEHSQETAVAAAIHNVRTFHELQKAYMTGGLASWPKSSPVWRLYGWRNDLPNGGFLGQQIRPLERVGVYVPGGKASYPSSVIMNAIPPLVAGVKEVYVSSPANKEGKLSPAVLFAIKSCAEIKGTFMLGGAAAIAAFAFGTETVPKVDKIVGPGNKYVNEAKRQLWGQVGLDLYAGPSEVCVLADDLANPAYAAADLLTQVEHSEDNVGFLVTLSEAKAKQILSAAEEQLKREPRDHIMRTALRDNGAVFIAKDMEQAIDIVNAIAPEHLTISVKDPMDKLDKIQNAGCILLGDYTPESAGDFILGPSHTLPTATASRFSGPVNVMDFLKVQSIVLLSKDDLKNFREAIETFGDMEGLPAHGYGATARFAEAVVEVEVPAEPVKAATPVKRKKPVAG